MIAERAGNGRRVLVGLGEVLWDLLPTGKQLGGAPANFTYHAHALGAEARLISRIGKDALGQETLDRLKQLGLTAAFVQSDSELPTGTAGVELASDGQPRFTIHEPAAWDALEATSAAGRAVADADALCFGTLAQRDKRSRAALRSLVMAAPPTALRVLDLNLRQHYYSRELIQESLDLAQALKLNDEELVELARILSLTGDTRAQVAALADRFRLRCVACTRGARGSLLFAEGAWSEHAGVPARVVDTVGAGDAFTAAMTLGLLAGWPLDEIHMRAIDVATFVCTQSGATPSLPDVLRAPFQNVGVGLAIKTTNKDLAG
jgi:fructokinase